MCQSASEQRTWPSKHSREKVQEKYLSTHHERDVETGLDYRRARFYDCDIARFLSLDPLAAQFASWSAYNYVMGNPVMLIDPDGRKADDYQLKADGSIDLIKKTNDRTDKIYASKANGEVDENKALEVSKDFMASKETVVTATGRPGDVYYVKNDMVGGNKIFKFMADNSNVEWGATTCIDKTNGNTHVILETDHNHDNVSLTGLTEKMTNLIPSVDVHSHPGNDPRRFTPTGFDHSTGQPTSPPAGDRQVALGLDRVFPNANVRSCLNIPNGNSYVHYNSIQIFK